MDQHVRVAQVVEERVTPAPARVCPGDQTRDVLHENRDSSAVNAADGLPPVRRLAHIAQPGDGAGARRGGERATDVGLDRRERVRGAPREPRVAGAQLGGGVEESGFSRGGLTDQPDGVRPPSAAAASDGHMSPGGWPECGLRLERLHRRGLHQRLVGRFRLPPPVCHIGFVVLVVAGGINIVGIGVILLVAVDLRSTLPRDRGEFPGGDRIPRRALRPLPHLRHDREEHSLPEQAFPSDPSHVHQSRRHAPRDGPGDAEKRRGGTRPGIASGQGQRHPRVVARRIRRVHGLRHAREGERYGDRTAFQMSIRDRRLDSHLVVEYGRQRLQLLGDLLRHPRGLVHIPGTWGADFVDDVGFVEELRHRPRVL